MANSVGQGSHPEVGLQDTLGVGINPATEDKQAPYSSIGTFRKTVSTAGTAEQFPSNDCKRVVVQALQDNDGAVTIGDANVVAAEATQRGIRLFSTNRVEIYVNNTDLLYIDAENNDDGVSVLFYD